MFCKVVELGNDLAQICDLLLRRGDRLFGPARQRVIGDQPPERALPVLQASGDGDDRAIARFASSSTGRTRCCIWSIIALIVSVGARSVVALMTAKLQSMVHGRAAAARNIDIRRAGDPELTTNHGTAVAADEGLRLLINVSLGVWRSSLVANAAARSAGVISASMVRCS